MAQPTPFSNVASPEQIALNRQLGQRMMTTGMDAAPVDHWTQALARVLQGGMGGYRVSQADEQQKGRNDAFMTALRGSGTLKGLNDSDVAILGQSPEMMQTVYSKVLGNKLDPQAGLRNQLLQLQLQGQQQDQQHQQVMRPFDIEMKKAQLAQAQQKDAFDQFIMNQMGGMGQQQAPQPSPQPQMRPMSAPGGAPMSPMPATMPDGGDPMLIPTQAGGGQPQPQPQEPTVQTPIGPMTQSKARQLGFIMAYKGKADAGKMIAESPTALGKEAKNENDKRELNTIELSSRLNQISEAYQDKFLTLPEQAKQVGLSWQAWITGKLPPEQMKARAEYVTFQQNVLTNLNSYIKEITGAAMTDGEAKRITAAAPSMGDDPVAFRAKLTAMKRQAGLAIARYRYLRENGFQGDVNAAAAQMPIERMGAVIREDTQKMMQDIRSQYPQSSPDQINGAVRAIIRQRYGLDA